MENEERRRELEALEQEDTLNEPVAPPDADRPLTAPEAQPAPGEPDIISPPPARPETERRGEPDLARGPHGEMPPAGTIPPPPAETVPPPPAVPYPPDTPVAAEPKAAEEDESRGRRIVAIILIVLGVWLLADQFIPFELGRLWPLVLIVVGFLLLTRRR